MKKLFLWIFSTCFLVPVLHAQIDPELLRIPVNDTIRRVMNMDAVYNRPFNAVGKLPVALGGYLETDWQHLTTDGVTEGHQFNFRRMTLFVSSTISRKIKFLSEIEFEEGGKEVAIEFAAVDVEFHRLANLRAGIIMNPIGSFNQNHDGPKWSFNNRPLSATEMLPATWSNAGVGLYGKQYTKRWMFGYEVYFSGGFDDKIIDNGENKTFLPASKENPERFEEINSGLPLLTAKVAARYRNVLEIGASYMGGVYNKFREDGLVLDKKRRMDVFAMDVNVILPKLHTNLVGEWAWVFVNVPATYTEQYGRKQEGGFLDVVQPFYRGNILGWKDAVFNLACRFEYVDWNKGHFSATGGKIFEDTWSVVPAISFFPTAETVFRVNYLRRSQHDLLGNRPAKTGGISAGISTYF